MLSLKKLIPELLILSGILLILLTYGPIIFDELSYRIKELKNQNYSLRGKDSVPDSPFARLVSTRPILLTPVNKEFSLVIEKIGVNVPIVKDVNVSDEKIYNAALKKGVAHSITSQYPSSEPGNVYLFAHSSINFWRLGRYAKVFNLLRKLEPTDRVHVFYKDDTYIYEVINKEVYKGWNTFALNRVTFEPILTLQTCDPPGTTFNRLVVTAKLIAVE